ncbi:oligosaccharide biosynthesis protein Alg14 [Kribbella amoyensis]|uniref:Oligosaccharide biosynthesis protein Alg14 n=1 Tax=Kribbella amoyensis TaxID=996641 RepID=A0A561BWK5_9ACTN|nr:PssD/Cps14F family polysaccharide biosynthesis glycosyltransferase [Kribbella amoyensis]TWD83270.1 oligosaccharide biosynthesis protein Alg14 [Kribbella amoyensis]
MTTLESPQTDDELAASTRVLMVCSSGGHLAQLMTLRPWWSQRDVCWVTFATEDGKSLLAGQRTVYAYHPTTRSLKNLVRNAVLAVRVLARERPDVIVTTGAGVALPFFVLGKLGRIPTVYIEVFDRIDHAPLTARLCKPFTSRMLVQWDEQQELYADSTVVGRLL